MLYRVKFHLLCPGSGAPVFTSSAGGMGVIPCATQWVRDRATAKDWDAAIRRNKSSFDIQIESRAEQDM